jgi:hypothetical protein
MSSKVSLIFYLSMFGLSSLCFYMSSKAKHSIVARGYSIIGLMIPVTIATLRYRVGVDYDSYVESASNLSNLPFRDFIDGKANYFEPTMYLIAKLTSASQNHAALFFGIYAAITIIFFYLAAKRFSGKQSWLIMSLYLLVMFSPSLNAVRQYASIAITFFASTYIIHSDKRSWRKYLMFMALACLFHSSAVIAMVLLPLLWTMSRNDVNNSKNILLIKNTILASLIYLFLYNFFYLIPSIPYIQKYATFIYDANVLVNHPPNPIVKIMPILIAFIFYKRLSKLTLNFTFYYLVLFAAFALSLTGNFIPQGYRLAEYFTPYYFIIFATLPELSKRYKIVYVIMILLYAIVYFTYSTFINNSYMTFPFHSILGVR